MTRAAPSLASRPRRAGTSGSATDAWDPTPSDYDEALDAACRLLEQARSVVVLAHVQPDADALGSALALGLVLSRRGTPTWVSFSRPDEVPESLLGLPGADLLRPPDELPDHPDLLVTVDVNAASRLGELARLTRTANRTLVIDHHASNTLFGTDHLIDPAAESTTVLIAAVIDQLGEPIDYDIAANLYAGLATDSVAFRYAGPAAHRLAARLLEAGVVPDELLRPITDSHPAAWLPMLSVVLGRARTLATERPGVELVWTWVSLDDARDLRSEEVDSVIDIIRTTAALAVVFKESAPNRWQVSLRSDPGVDVAELASRLGGGGHRRAAGYVHTGHPQDGIRALLDLLGVT